MLKDYGLEEHRLIDFSLLSLIVIQLLHRCNVKIWDIFDLLGQDPARPYNR
jgi:hypothetical protein